MKGAISLLVLILPTLYLSACNRTSDAQQKSRFRLKETISLGGLMVTPFNSDYPEMWPNYLTLPDDTYMPGFGVISKSGLGYTANCYRKARGAEIKEHFSNLLKRENLFGKASEVGDTIDLAWEDKAMGLKGSIYSIPNSSSIPKGWTHFFVHIEPIGTP